MEIKDKYIATIEALHDMLLDNHGYSLEHRTLKDARELTSLMYKAIDKQNPKVVHTGILTEKHQDCIEILEGISHLQKKRWSKIDSINGFPGTFPDLRRKYINDVDTIERAINRLYERYFKYLNRNII